MQKKASSGEGTEKDPKIETEEEIKTVTESDVEEDSDRK